MERDVSHYTPEQLAAFNKHKDAWVKIYHDIDTVFKKEMAEITSLDAHKNPELWGMPIDRARELKENEKDLFKTDLLLDVNLILQLYNEQKAEAIKPELIVGNIIQNHDLRFNKLLFSEQAQDQQFIEDLAGLCIAADEYSKAMAIKPL